MPSRWYTSILTTSYQTDKLLSQFANTFKHNLNQKSTTTTTPAMLFNKNILLASVFASSASAASLRKAHRALTDCPEQDPRLGCLVYKNGQVIATLASESQSLELDSFDPSACYDISCTANGLDPSGLPFVNFLFKSQEHKAANSPYNLGGKSTVRTNNCQPLASSCEDLVVTIEAWQTPDNREPTKVNNYMCQSKVITCAAPPPSPPTDTKSHEEGKDSSSSDDGMHYSKGGDSSDSGSKDDGMNYSKGGDSSDSASKDGTMSYSKGGDSADSGSKDDGVNYSKGGDSSDSGSKDYGLNYSKGGDSDSDASKDDGSSKGGDSSDSDLKYGSYSKGEGSESKESSDSSDSGKSYTSKYVSSKSHY